MSEPRDPYRDEREGARIHEERRREEAEEKRSFAKSLRRRLYGRIGILVFSLVAAVGLLLKIKPRADQPSTPQLRLLTPPACSALASSYRASLSPLRKCAADADCSAEARGGIASGLDGCVRIISRAVDAGAANAIANDWMVGGCAKSFRTCKQPRAPICEEGACTESPPEGVPRSWQRREVPGLLTFFAPKDIAPAELDGIPEDSWVTQFASGDLRLTFDVQSGGEPDAEAPEPHGGQRYLSTVVLELDGLRARLSRVKSEYDGRTRVQALFPYYPAAPEAAMLGGGSGFVDVWAVCKDDAECALVERIFKTIERW